EMCRRRHRPGVHGPLAMPCAVSGNLLTSVTLVSTGTCGRAPRARCLLSSRIHAANFTIGRLLMKSMYSVILGVTFASLLCTTSVRAAGHGTYDSVPPADEQVCDKIDLDAGAYGLCIAYCEATDCDLRPNRRDCVRIRENFAARTGSDVLPCDRGPVGGVQ